jgi:peptidoglycan hydrolase-like protein with peptidoglycan-binding domain
VAEPAVTEPVHHAGAYHGSNGTPTLVVLHDEEFPLSDTSAEVIARNVFSKANAGGCAQYVVDSNSEQHPCAEADLSWNAPPNMTTIGIERDGYASWSRKAWRQPKAQMTTCRVAARTAEILGRRHLPVRFNEVADLKAAGPTGAKGVTTHNNRSKAFGQSDHTDPGPQFPIAEFMALVRRAFAWFRDHESITAFQDSHGLKSDGVVGEKTLNKAATVLYGKGDPAPAKPQPKPVPHPRDPNLHTFAPEPQTGYPLTLWMSGPRCQGLRDRLGVDGADQHFDQDLAAAVIQFQRAHTALTPTGKVDRQTWNALFPAPKKPSKAKAFPDLDTDGIPGPKTIRALAVAVGSRSRKLDKALRKAVQRHLKIADDGVWGDLTIRHLQAHVGAHVDGVIGADTWLHIQEALRDGQF